MKFETGSKIGDYEILGPLGAGGMGRVYRVRNELSDRVEAMKVLLPDLEGQADLATRFLREIKVQAGLDHPNIAKLYTALRIDNQLLMCMELVEGVTLDQRLRAGPIPLADTIDYVAQVLAALAYAHQRGVVHRDIKPPNMMLMSNGVIKLLDFGIAKAAVDTHLTLTGTTLGSLYYMSPEQIQGGMVDARSDVYAVGVSLYELVTGKKPFDADSQFAIMSAHLARMPVPPVEMNADVPVAVSEIILVALNKDPAMRFQTAGEFLNALREVQPDAGAGAGTATALPLPPPAGFRTTAPPGTSPLRTVAPLASSVPSFTAMRPGVMQPPPESPEPEPVTEIEPAGVPAKNEGARRLLWVAVGSLAAVLAVVVFIQLGPRDKTSARETPLPMQIEAPAPKRPGTPPAAPAAPVRPAAAQPVKPPGSGDNRKLPVQPEPGRPAAAQPAPAQPAPQQPQPPPADNTLAAQANKNRADVQRLGERLDQMYPRARAVRTALTAQGGSHPDWVESFNRLNGFLKQASIGINDANPFATNEAIEKAEKELEALEKAVGK